MIRSLCVLLCGVTAASGAGIARAALSFEVRTNQHEYAVGEPIRVTGVLRNDSGADLRVIGVDLLGDNMEHMLYEIRMPNGRIERRYHGFVTHNRPIEDLYPGELLPPGDSLIINLYPRETIVWEPGGGGHSSETFARPGTYGIRLVYRVPTYWKRLWRHDDGELVSNEAIVSYRRATGAEREILDACWTPQNPSAECCGEMTGQAAFDESALRDVIRRYPDHPMIGYAYLALGRSLTRWKGRAPRPTADEGARVLHELIERFPRTRYVAARYHLARYHLDRGDREEATHLLEACLAKNGALIDEMDFMSAYSRALTGDYEAFRRWQYDRQNGNKHRSLLEYQ